MKLNNYILYTIFILLLGLNHSFSQTTFGDNFTTQQYNQNDGTGNWSTNWIETNDDGSPLNNGGDIFIFVGLGNVLAFVGNGANNNGGHGINRTVDLNGATSATLSFDWRAQNLDTFNGDQEELGIFISNDNGVNFTQISPGTIVGNNTGTVTLDISAFISANTVFRLQVIGGNEVFENNEFAFIDNLIISAIFGPSVSVTEISVNEDVGTATYEAILTGGDVTGGFTVDYSTADNTALVGDDYTTSSGTLIFLGNNNEIQTFTVPIIDNNFGENNETFFINLGNASSALVNVITTSTQTIIDDGDPPIPVNTPLTLFDQFNGTIDYAVAGGTLRTNNDITDPCSVTTSSTGTFTNSSLIPSTASVSRAYLFWAHSNINPDTQVTFEGQSVNATVVNQSNFNGPMYGMAADVTGIINNTTDPYNHTYTFTDLTIDSSNTYCVGPTVLGAWSLMVFYEDDSIFAARINLYNGFSGERNSDSDFTLDGFFAIDPIGAKTTVLSWEGDPTTATAAGEQLTITSPLPPLTITALEGDGDNINGNNRPFNSTIYDGTSGLNTNSFGIDLDTYNLENIIRLGENSITIDVASGNDFVIINSLVIRVPSNLITGTVFEDINYPGGNGRSQINSNGVGVENATVELYIEAPINSGTFVLQDINTTDSLGEYVFAGMPDGNYKVRVVNSSVQSNRGGGTTCITCLPVQTFRQNFASGGTFSDITTEIGGSNIAGEDTPAITTLGTALNNGAQTISDVTINGEGADGLDFGFNFNTIVNTNESGQGSLEQFIINANNLNETGLDIEAHPNDATLNPLPGEDTSIFMIPTDADPLGRTIDTRYNTTDGYFDILTTSNLSAITGANTKIDGRTQTAYSGNTNTSSIVPSVTTVGTTMVALPTYDSPEIQVQNASGGNYGFDILSDNVTVRNMAIFANGNAADAVRITSGSGIIIQSNTIGLNAIGTFEGNTRQGIRINGGTSTITENYISGNRVTGIRTNNSPNTTISLNYILANGTSTCDFGSIGIRGAALINIQNNLIDNGGSFGIKDINGNIIITGNTITNSGQNTGCTNNSGIQSSASDSQITNNIIHSNTGSGISLTGTTSGNLISQNSIYANGTLTTPALGIDLGNDGITINDLGDGDGDANDKLNFPVFESVTIRANQLKVIGWSPPGAIIELFVTDISEGTATLGDNQFGTSINQDYGEGQTYIGTITEGSSSDIDTSISLYPPDIDGNTDNTNRFNITLNLATTLSTNTLITATATVANTTSEFGVVYAIRSGTVITNRRITYRVKK